MSKTLIVNFLPRENSNTRQLVEAFTSTYTGDVISRSLDGGSVPLMSETALKTWWGPAVDSDIEAASKEFISELKQAENVIIATPMYNWSLPAPVKAWLDLVIRGGQTFASGPNGVEGLLDTKKVALLMTTGMTEPESEQDHLSPVIQAAFAMTSKASFSVISAGQLFLVGEEEIKSRMDKAVEAAKTLGADWS